LGSLLLRMLLIGGWHRATPFKGRFGRFSRDGASTWSVDDMGTPSEWLCANGGAGMLCSVKERTAVWWKQASDLTGMVEHSVLQAIVINFVFLTKLDHAPV
jgi:hypothetical protein